MFNSQECLKQYNEGLRTALNRIEETDCTCDAQERFKNEILKKIERYFVRGMNGERL